MKEFHLHMRDDEKKTDNLLTSYLSTDVAISHENKEVIHSTIVSLCTTDLIKAGYKIFVHMIDGEVIEIKVGGDNKYTDKEIRMSNSLPKLILAGVFGVATYPYF